MDNIKTWTGLPVEKSVRVTEDRDGEIWRKYVNGVAKLSDQGRLKNRTEQPHKQAVFIRLRTCHISLRGPIPNDTMFFSKTAISILVISNHNSFRELFDKIASVYLLEKYIYILPLEMASAGNRHCANFIGTLSPPLAIRRSAV